ncbi:hypothetical protein QJQ45_013429 [Haematococcus lacustris]|nr:hypothetical protein QJQ45_013429 [Haematococcus lacustris]
MSESQGEQLEQLMLDMAKWDRLEKSSRDQLTQGLMRCLGVGSKAESVLKLSKAAWALVVLGDKLPPSAAASAFSAFIRHCASSKAIKRGSWRAWSSLLHALDFADVGVRCSDSPELTRLCDQAVQLLPGKLILPWLPIGPSQKLSVHAQALCESEQSSPAKLNLEQLVAVVEKLPVQLSSSQGEQLVQLVQEMADWDRLTFLSRGQLTQTLLECLMVGDKAKDPYQLSMAAWSLAMLKRHLPPPAEYSAFLTFLFYCASSKVMKRGSWRDWGQLLHALESAGVQCSDFAAMTWLCSQAVRSLPRKLVWSLSCEDIIMPLGAMASMGYKGRDSAQPVLQAVTAAINQETIMVDAGFPHWRKLIMAAGALHGCSMETRQLLAQFAAKAGGSLDALNAEYVSSLLKAVSLAMWPNTEFVKQLAVRAAGHPKGEMDSSKLAISLCSLAFLGYLDSSVRAQDSSAWQPRSMFLALSIHQTVSSGQSQLASEPQLNSMAAALWRECSRRGAVGQQWSEQDLLQLHTATQSLDACTGGQISLAASPALQELVGRAANVKRHKMLATVYDNMQEPIWKESDLSDDALTRCCS